MLHNINYEALSKCHLRIQTSNSLLKLTATRFQSHAYYVFLDSNNSSEWGASSLTFLGPCIRLSINVNFHHTLKASLKTFVKYSSKGYTFILYLLAIWGFILYEYKICFIYPSIGNHEKTCFEVYLYINVHNGSTRWM